MSNQTSGNETYVADGARMRGNDSGSHDPQATSTAVRDLSDQYIVVIPDRQGNYFWSFYSKGLTVMSHDRWSTEEWARQAARLARQRILEALEP